MLQSVGVTKNWTWLGDWRTISIECLLCDRKFFKWFTWEHSFNSHNYLKGRKIIFETVFSAQRSYPRPRSGVAAKRRYLASKVRGGREEPRCTRGQGWRPGRPTLHPRSGGCMGTGGPRGAIPCARSGGVALRRYPSHKVRSSGCAWLEQPWRNTLRPR